MTGWQRARELAHELGRAHPATTARVPLAEAAGRTLAADQRADRALPPFDNSAMDGWAVAGDPPWREGIPVLAGAAADGCALEAGEARPIATGAPVPHGTATVLRAEEGILSPGPDGVLLDTVVPLAAGRDIRHRGEEVDAGELLLTAGTRLTPPAVGLLAATGADSVVVARPPAVTTIATGDELAEGSAAPGTVTDALTPLMPSALAALGAECARAVRVPDGIDELEARLRSAGTPLVITSGGTAHGPADVLRDAIDRVGGRVVLDGLALSPGRSVLLVELPDGRLLLALPGNPLAALIDLIVLGGPLIGGILGAASPELPSTALPLGIEPQPRPRAIACVRRGEALVPVPHQRSGMLRGIATATHLALVDGSGAHLLRLPWC